MLARQLDEAIRIAGEEGKLLNDKFEWVRPAGVAISINRKRESDTLLSL